VFKILAVLLFLVFVVGFVMILSDGFVGSETVMVVSVMLLLVVFMVDEVVCGEIEKLGFERLLLCGCEIFFSPCSLIFLLLYKEN
jgi:hypothetical protein